MQVIVSARHMTLTDALKVHAEEKLGEAVMRKFDRPALKIAVELLYSAHAVNGANYECKVTVFVPKGKTIVISETDDDMYKAIDLAHHRLLLQVDRERGRKKKKTVTRKFAERERHSVARDNLTTRPEPWEREVAEFEASVAP